MKQTYLKSFCARFLTLLVLALLSTNLAWGETATITFANQTSGTSDGSTTYTTSNFVSSGIASSDEAFGTITCSETSKCYSGKIGYGLKAGGSSNAGSFTISFTALSNVTKIVLNRASYSDSKTANITVKNGETTLANAVTTPSGSADFSNMEITGLNIKSLSTLTVNTSKYCYIKSITITYSATEAAVKAPTFSVEAGNYSEAKSVELSCATEGATIYYTTDGTEPSAESTSYTSAITVNKSMTIKAIAIKGDDKSSVATAAYKITTYTSLEELVADGDPGTTGYPVTVTLTNEVIREFYKSGEYTNGVYLNVPTSTGTKEIEIYCQNVPEDWQVNGTLSGTLESVTWKNYNGTWEICPDSWDDLTYTDPSKTNPTITATYKTSLKAGETDVYTVTYSGDGELSITSSDEDVATATIAGSNVTITAKSAGTTTITISAAETDNYYATEETYTLIVIAPASLPFAFDGGKDDIGTTAGMSQTGLGGDYSGSPKLKFDSANDNLVIWFDGQADYVSYDIKGNGSNNNPWEGTFDVKESADGNTYTSVASYTELGDKKTEIKALKSDTRYVKFVYTSKTLGNVALGNIKIGKAYKATITDAKYATLGLPYAATIPEGVSAYTATVEGTTVTMTKISAIPANCGVILYAETPGDYTFTQTTPPNLFVNNKLVAALEAYTCTGEDVGKVYYLGKDNDGKATFKKLNENGTIAAGKAYLKLDAAISAAKLDVTFGEPTGITSYENDNENENLKSMTVYNLNGMKVNEHYKGIVIMNGKKYINK